MWTFVRHTIRTAKPTATLSRPSILARLDSPRFRSLRILIQSSRNPTTPAPAMARTEMMPVHVNTPSYASDTR